MKIKNIFLLLVLAVSIIKSQTKTELFPDNLTIQPFVANALEPKLGFIFKLSKNELRLDIGNSLDIIRVNAQDNTVYSFGADLFTYTLLRGEHNFHFPVDAVDYLFGLNFGYRKNAPGTEYGFRFRLSHISAHFVDGHYDGTIGGWRDGRTPRVYSREFIELMPFYKINGIRIYAGLTYLFHVDPVSIHKDNYQLGFDHYFKNTFGDHLTPFVGYDFKMIHLDKYTGNNSLTAGVKLGKPEGKGLSAFLSYYSGKSIHGEYFDYNVNYTAFGINLDL